MFAIDEINLLAIFRKFTDFLRIIGISLGSRDMVSQKWLLKHSIERWTKDVI